MSKDTGVPGREASLIEYVCFLSTNHRARREYDELVEALRDAEFLLRKVAINTREASHMLDSLVRSAEDARAALAKAEVEV